MKKLLVLSWCVISLIFIACGSGGKTTAGGESTPSGNPEKDAAAFSEVIYEAYSDNNAELMKQSIDEYYEFYKKQPVVDQQVFFEAFKDNLEKWDGKIDEEKFGTMIQEADPYEKMDKLYHATL